MSSRCVVQVSKACPCHGRGRREPFFRRRAEGTRRREDNPWEGRPLGSRRGRGREENRRRGRLYRAGESRVRAWACLSTDTSIRSSGEPPSSHRNFSRQFPEEHRREKYQGQSGLRERLHPKLKAPHRRRRPYCY